MSRYTVIFIAGLLLLVGALGVVKYLQIQQGMSAMAAGTPPPASVEVTTARVVDWQPVVPAVGTLTARAGIDVRNEVEGIVEAIHVESGDAVKQGEMLIELNNDVEQADLASFEAQSELARVLFERNERMWKQKTISETDYDNTRYKLMAARADVDRTRARIAKKRITAPFSGVLGIRHVNTGQYVAPGTMLISLQDYKLLYTDFSVPERYLPDLAPGLEVRFRVSAYPDRDFTGKVQALDARVDEATRSIGVRAQLSNDDGRLRPGMYADIDLVLRDSEPRIVVPSTAIVFSSFGNAVFVVEENDEGKSVARRVQVTTGEQRGDLVAVTRGLDGGEQVVQAGTGKLRNDMQVAISAQPRLQVEAP